MHAFPRVAILLKARIVVAPLMVEHHDVRALRDLAQIAKRASLRRYRAAVHARPDAVRAARALRGAVVQLPDFDPAIVVPQDPLPVGRVVPIRLPRERAAGLRAKLAVAIRTVANALPAHSGPTVVGKPIRMRALDNLSQNAGKIFIVIGAVDARDVLVRGSIRFSVDVAREPIGARLEEIFSGAVRIHSSHYEQPVLVSRLRQFSEQVAAVQEL